MFDCEFSLDRCSLCSAQPVAVFWLEEGCAAFPEKRLQALCPQHIVKSQPCGDMELLLSLCGSGPVPGWDKF